MTVQHQQREEGCPVHGAGKGRRAHIGGKIRTLGKVTAEIRHLHGLQIGHGERLLNVQGARSAVGAEAVIIIHAVGQVRALLHLGHHDAGADGVQRAGRDEEHIPRLHRHGVQHLGHGAGRDVRGEPGPRQRPFDAIIKARLRRGVEHEPHLGLAVLALVCKGVGIIRVDLD